MHNNINQQIMNRTFLNLLFLLVSALAFGQFHSLNIPKLSPPVSETQRLGVTDITITYSSPALRGRAVWNNPNIIPQNNEPRPWRAGADMATTIDFTTDVMIEGQALKAGTYAFYVIPRGETYELLFAHNYEQWGSYYLDQDKDVTLRVEVKSEPCAKSEQLDYEFLNRSENSLDIALEWDQTRLPFTVEVDLTETVVASFRQELRGANTYHWQAWNDAAMWCYNHDTNLEEALVWANRSIDGGLNGFAADRNYQNMSTKILLEKKLAMTDQMHQSIQQAMTMNMNEQDSNAFNIFLLRLGSFDEALSFSKQSLKKYPDAWSILLNKSIANYYLGNTKSAVKDIDKVIKVAPEMFMNRLNEIKEEFINQSYQLSNRYS